MEPLPTESVLQVLGHLEKVDLKALRMVNSKLSDLCSPLLFNRVYASAHRKDIEVLNHISSHPIFSSIVTELVYNGSCFCKRVLNDLKNNSDPNVEYYENCFEEQKLVLADGSNEREIGKALKRLPKLQRIILTNHWLPTRDLLGKCSPEDRRDGVRAPEGARSAGPLSRDYPTGLKHPSAATIHMSVHGAPPAYIDHAFIFMSWAVVISNAQVQELVIDFCGVICAGEVVRGISLQTFDLPERDLHVYYPFFQHLRRIYFSLEQPFSFNEYEIMEKGNFRKLLTSADCLEELSLDFGNDYSDTELPSLDMDVSLEAYLGSHCWPHLRLLKLYRKVCTETELSNLIQRHCKSLKVLRLEQFSLHRGTWQEAAEKWHQSLQLDNIECYELRELHWSRGYTAKTVKCDEFEEYVMNGESDPIYNEGHEISPRSREYPETVLAEGENGFFLVNVPPLHGLSLL